MSPDGKTGYAKKTFSDNREKMGGSEYLVNISLQNNEKISLLFFNLIGSCTELYNTIPEIRSKRSRYNKKLRQRQNNIYPSVRKNYTEIFYSTKGFVEKVIEKNRLTKYDTLIQRTTNLLIVPYHRQNIRVFCTTCYEYLEMLQTTGIVPITANFTDKDGFASLYTQ